MSKSSTALLSFAFTALIASFGAAAPAAPAPARQTPAAQLADKQGDDAFRKRQSDTEALAALDLYRKAYAAQPGDPEAGWRLAMACYFVGFRLSKNDSEKRALFDEGRDAGEAAAEAAPDCAPCHFWSAIDEALYGESVGVLKMLFTLKRIREHLELSLRADPSYAYGGAYRLLGLIEQKLPGILGGSDDRAREDFEKAISVAPDEPLNYLFLGRLYADTFHAPAKAAELARKGLAIRGLAPDRLESIEAQGELRALSAAAPASAAKDPAPDPALAGMTPARGPVGLY